MLAKKKEIQVKLFSYILELQRQYVGVLLPKRLGY